MTERLRARLIWPDNSLANYSNAFVYQRTDCFLAKEKVAGSSPAKCSKPVGRSCELGRTLQQGFQVRDLLAFLLNDSLV